MRRERFLGKWGDEWGKVAIQSGHGMIGFGVWTQTVRLGTRVGDPRRRFAADLTIVVLFWTFTLTVMWKRDPK